LQPDKTWQGGTNPDTGCCPVTRQIRGSHQWL
jgi:hypothetical protein